MEKAIFWHCRAGNVLDARRLQSPLKTWQFFFRLYQKTFKYYSKSGSSLNRKAGIWKGIEPRKLANIFKLQENKLTIRWRMKRNFSKRKEKSVLEHFQKWNRRLVELKLQKRSFSDLKCLWHYIIRFVYLGRYLRGRFHFSMLFCNSDSSFVCSLYMHMCTCSQDDC